MRKIFVCLGWMISLFPTCLLAVGLGNIQVFSGLNQPLNAQVPIVDIGNVLPDSIHIGLASPDQFQLAGLDSLAESSTLKFSVLRASNGQVYVQINSTAPIEDPVLSFLVNLSWPNGQMLREYRVFLDPVGYAKPATAPLEPSVAAVDTTVNESIQASPVYGPTTSEDDLWEIAKKTRPQNTSVQQNMVAIYEKNREGFVNQNINQLKTGYILTLPSPVEVKALSTVDALNFLKTQDKTKDLAESEVPPKRRTSLGVSENMSINQPPELLDVDANNQVVPVPIPRVSTTAALSATQKALGVDSEKSQETLVNNRVILNNEIEALQKKLIEKDREILMYQKELADLKKIQSSAMAGIKLSNVPDLSEEPPLENTIKVQYVPWYGYVIFLFSIVAALWLGMKIQYKRHDKESGTPLSKETIETGLPPVNDRMFALTQDALSQIATDLPVSDTSAEGSEDKQSSVGYPSEVMEKVLKQVEIFMHEGKYVQAKNALENLLKKTGMQFEIGIKLLDIYALMHDKEDFLECYMALDKLPLSKTQRHLFDMISSHFFSTLDPSMLAEQQLLPAASDKKPSDDESAFETRVKEEKIPEGKLGVSVEQEKQQVTEADSVSNVIPPQNTLPEIDENVIEFESGLSEGMISESQSQAIVKTPTQTIDELAWDNMLSDLSLAPLAIQDNHLDHQPDSLLSAVSEEIMATPNIADLSETAFTSQDIATQLDLAKTYIDIGDTDEAKVILMDILKRGDAVQKLRAEDLLSSI